MSRSSIVFAALLALPLAAGCPRSRTPGSLSTDGGLRTDSGRPRTDAGPGCVPVAETCNRADDDCDGLVDEGLRERVPVTDLDVLFLVDNSNSMTEEQESFARELPRLVRVLATGDLDGDGAGDFTPPRSLHFGVVTSDMGTGGFTVPTCSEPNFGDDGVLRTQGNTSIAGCMASYPNFLEFRADSGATPEPFAQELRCVAQLGTGGCGFEQQLEAVLKAVTPSTSGISFGMGTTGNGDAENAGFLRPDAMLAVVVLTDEEDCSAADSELFNPSSAVYSGNLNLRCFSYPMAVHPIERYVDGLLALKSDPSQVFFAVIAGIPPDLAESSATYDAILADDRMQEQVDPADPNRLRPSCNVPGRGLAFPPRRLVRVAQQLESVGASATLGSICQADYSAVTTRLLAALADATATVETCR